MAELDFATTILTSKSPEEVANFLAHSLAMSSTLIEKDLVVWFSNYVNMIMKFNQDLNALVANGRNTFTRSDAEFGSIDKIWNCVASCVMLQIQVNDLLVRVLRQDVIGQFARAFRDDYSYSELLVNSDELLEMLRNAADANGAYAWNAKAPAILANFENYKRHEKDLLFSAFLAYLNTVNSKTALLLNKNENAVNFILKEFDVNTEMKNYTDYMVRTRAPPATPKTKPAPKPEPRTKSSRASIASASSGPTPKAEKRKSKLRLKVGSILGCKKKDSHMLHVDAIPEDHLVASVASASASVRSSIYAPPPPARPTPEHARSSFSDHGRSSVSEQARASEPRASEPRSEQARAAPERAVDSPHAEAHTSRSSHSTASSPPASGPQASSSAVPVAAAAGGAAVVGAVAAGSFASRPTTVDAQPLTPTEDEPNLVKYSSSDSDSDVPTDAHGNRLLMLQAHSLDQPPRLDTDSARLRNTSSGKYSFEYGDEEKLSASATPRVGSSTFPSAGAAPAPAVPASTAVAASTSSVTKSDELPPVPTNEPVHTPVATRPPPPPPARKVHATEKSAGTPYTPGAAVATNVKPAERVVSQTFANLHSARESFHHDGMSLVSQTTGNSLFRPDRFRHFGDSITKEGLNTSVAELISANFVNGELRKAQVLGEVAFNYNSASPLDKLDVRIPTKFSKFLLNDLFVEQKGAEDFVVHVSPITGKTLGGIKYLIDQGVVVPILVKQVWRYEPHQASLVIRLTLNPAYDGEVTLENLIVSAALDSSVASTSATSKPEGFYNRDANRVTWRFSQPLVFNASHNEEKLITRIMTSGQGKEAASGVQIRFAVSQPARSSLELLDESGLAISSVRSLSSGNYSSHT